MRTIMQCVEMQHMPNVDSEGVLLVLKKVCSRRVFENEPSVSGNLVDVDTISNSKKSETCFRNEDFETIISL